MQETIWLPPVEYDKDIDYVTHKNDTMYSPLSGDKFLSVSTDAVHEAFDSRGKEIASEHHKQYGDLIGLTFQQMYTYGKDSYIYLYEIVDRFAQADRFIIRRMVVPLPPAEPDDEKG